MIELFFLFSLKHFICDFPLQAHPYLYGNKGKYGHPGGIIHAGIHGLGTMLILPAFPFAAIADFAAHYHIDFLKMRVNAHYNLKPDNSEWFWILLGFDQLLHYATYAGILLWLR